MLLILFLIRKMLLRKKIFNRLFRSKIFGFKYDNEYVLKDFSLEIPKGKTVALVGVV